MKIKFILLVILFYCSQASGSSLPDYSNNLTGDWTGARSKLYNAGFDINLKLEPELSIDSYNDSTIYSEIDLKLYFDGKKLFNIDGSKAFIYLISSSSSKNSKLKFELDQAWISQDIYSDKLNILAGIYDIDAEFNQTKSAAIFFQPTYSLNDELSQNNANSNSYGSITTFPTSSLGGRVKFKPNDFCYMQAAIVDVAITNNVSNIQEKQKHSSMIIAETGIASSYGNYSFGLWQFDKKFLNLIDAQSKKRNNGYYIMGEKSLYKEGNQELFAFIRYGKANKQVVQIDYSWSAGLVLNEVIKGRKDSQLGFAVRKAHISNNYIIAQENNKSRKLETSLELTYSDKPYPWLQIQPDLQYIIKPALNIKAGDPYPKSKIIALIWAAISF